MHKSKTVVWPKPLTQRGLKPWISCLVPFKHPELLSISWSRLRHQHLLSSSKLILGTFKCIFLWHLNLNLSWRKEEIIVVHIVEREVWSRVRHVEKKKERSCPHSNKTVTRNLSFCYTSWCSFTSQHHIPMALWDRETREKSPTSRSFSGHINDFRISLIQILILPWNFAFPVNWKLPPQGGALL